jgi:hypothetical protein
MPTGAEVVIEMNLFGDHALGFDDFFGPGLLKDVGNGAAGVFGRDGEMHLGALAFQALVSACSR